MAFRTLSQLFRYGVIVMYVNLPSESCTSKGGLPYVHGFHDLPGPCMFVPLSLQRHKNP